MKFIKNVKISVKYFSEEPIKHLITIASDRNVYMKQIRNILIIKDIYSLTVFKQEKNKYHFNVTGIKNLGHIKQTLVWLENTYCNKKHFQYISFKTDNITSTFDTEKHIALDNLAKFVNGSSYNPERFHALYFKNCEGTVVVFRTGKVNIVGCKSLKNILSLWTFIRKKINAVCMITT